jgi:SAM-dependent methyltransferase
MDVVTYNKRMWDRRVAEGDRWTLPVTAEIIAAARRGEWEIVLTPSKPVPRDWFPALAGTKVLCLASGGGQQGPVLAAAGADVTVFDNSPRQLAQDRLVADREGLNICTVEGDMVDLSHFADATFDLIFHPCANGFVPEIKPVWREAFRVLKSGGSLLSGFTNPVVYTVDPRLEAQGVVQLKYSIPYSDLTSITDEDRQRYAEQGEPLSFGHSLDDQIGGQIAAGFVITGFFEDGWTGAQRTGIHQYLDGFIATRALKPVA